MQIKGVNMDKWEYNVQDIQLTGNELVNTLNRMGQDGWELILVDGRSFYFKRKKK
jgi:hypothetical protein